MFKIDTPIPERMEKNCKKDKRGLPVPYIVLIDDEGTPQFKINDTYKVDLALRWKFCAICGTYLRDDIWFVGGPQSAFHEAGAYIDTAIHYECGAYALKVCPYLASRGYNTYAPVDKVKNVKKEGRVIYVDPTLDPDRPKVFAFVKTTGWRIHEVNALTRYVIPKRPYLEVEFWNQGVKLLTEEALAIIASNDKSKGMEFTESIIQQLSEVVGYGK